MDLGTAFQIGGPFGAGLFIGLTVAALVWKQLLKQFGVMQNVAVAMTAIDKTLGFLVDEVKDANGTRRGRR